MSAQLRLAVLGPLRAWRGGQPLDLGPIRQQALLAALVLRPDVPVSQQELLESVWGTEPPGTGGKVVPVYVHRLRKCLRADGAGPADSVIGTGRGGYRFASAGVRLDSVRLAEILAEANAADRAGDLAGAVHAYAGALELFRGEPLAGLPGPFAAGERLRLTERRTALLQEKLERQLRLGRYADAVAELSALLPAHPHNEPLGALLMRALYGSGRAGDALAVFTRLRRRLVDDLGVEPGGPLRRVQQAVLRGEDELLGVTAVGRARPARPRNELPADTGELAGRGPELASLGTPADAAVVSVDAVHGVAGAGKTALVVRAAHRLRADHPDGCLFVDLHGHTEGRTPLTTQRALRRLLRSVGVDDSAHPDDPDELTACWRSASASLRLLLVLDDAAGAGQVRPLLPTGPGSRVLVTSRQRLTGLEVQRRISLEPLDLDTAGELLGRIAGGSRAAREPGAVRELARLCGRLPLALWLAGARLQDRPMWTFQWLVERLADDERRLGELAAGDRSVAAALRLSYAQLPVAARRAFRALGQCPTVRHDRLGLAAMLDCSAEEAERLLEGLVDASLLEQPAAGRYRLHDLVAVYARHAVPQEHGETLVAARIRVFELCIAAARCASDWGFAGYPTGPTPFTGWAEAAAWLDAAGGELVDVVGQAAADGHADHACRLAEALVDYLTRQGRYHECRGALEIALPLADQAGDRRLASSLRLCFGLVAGTQGRYEQAGDWFAEALRIGRCSGDRREEARALGGLGMVATALGRYAQALERLTEAVAMAEELADHWLAGTAISGIGFIHHVYGRHEEALDCFARSGVLGEKTGSVKILGNTMCATGSVQLELGRPAEAAIALRQAVELAERLGDVQLHAFSLTRLGSAEQEMGNQDTGTRLHYRALAMVTEQTTVDLELEIRARLAVRG
ncbi:AfsR/SARP family transcriptional regulator [Amycolatopsis cihanbeyliensis]|uniref:DNA-binding SARP family transcriptional activator n=1 Tax=Amycolatopsis cihanbeyliensis TaxID=1128664 RepID=A0A542DMH0_AMYCI|nr:BTAD domain-containing putative transcriptional regulator [Amycolatopsis cihanbeyliensis]TQJ04293.1 DNA-binding SARP family transcriptional activator [Amycolatopsis cihanbeyliensis]